MIYLISSNFYLSVLDIYLKPSPKNMSTMKLRPRTQIRVAAVPLLNDEDPLAVETYSEDDARHALDAHDVADDVDFTPQAQISLPDKDDSDAESALGAEEYCGDIPTSLEVSHSSSLDPRSPSPNLGGDTQHQQSALEDSTLLGVTSGSSSPDLVPLSRSASPRVPTAEFITQMAFVEDNSRLRPVMLLYMPGRTRPCAPYSLAQKLGIEVTSIPSPHGYVQPAFDVNIIGHMDQRIPLTFFATRTELIRESVPLWLKKTIKKECLSYVWVLLSDDQYREITRFNGGDSAPDFVASYYDLPFSTETRVKYFV